MEYKISIQKEPEYLHVCYVAETVTLDIAKVVLSKIADACQQRECKRVLFEPQNPKRNLSISDIFWLGKTVVDIGLKDCKIAAVIDARKYDGSVDFFKTIAYNRVAFR